VGYLRITSFHDYTDDDDYAKGFELIKIAANKIFEQMLSLKALIIDIRANGGGNDPYQMVVASHLTDVPYLAGFVKARNSAVDPTSFTVPQQIFVRPATGPRFLGKAILLTGRDTASAGEGLVLSLMNRVPQIIRVGENTQGAFSEELDRRLPNGWRVVLPNEVDFTMDGKSFHHVGVPPDTRVTGLHKAGIAAGKDPGLKKALEIVQLP
jgi:C-terminal processing protease CtpA/Prc